MAAVRKNSAPRSNSIKTSKTRTSSSKGQKSKAADSTDSTGDDKLTVEWILGRCQENSIDRVFDIDLSGQLPSKIIRLSMFNKLRILDVSCNQIKVIENLDNNLELRELKLYSNKIVQIQGLEKLKELTSLHLQHNQIQTIGKGLLSLKKMKICRLDNNSISTIDHRELGSCSQLNQLDLSYNRLQDGSALNNLPNLEELSLSNNRLTKVPALDRCKKLQELDLSHNHLTNLTNLKALTCLVILRLNSTGITSLDFIGKLKNLSELYLSRNSIKKLESLVPLNCLEVLECSDNQIQSWNDVCVLSKLSSLVELNLSGNPFVTGMVNYHHNLHKVLTNLEVLDGVTLKRPTTSTGHRPAMRPMSASQVVSSRQVDEQIKALEHEQVSFQESFSSRFDMMQDLFKRLPLDPPPPTPRPRTGTPLKSGHVSDTPQFSATEPRPVSRCNSRARLQQAMSFAAEHFTINEVT